MRGEVYLRTLLIHGARGGENGPGQQLAAQPARAGSSGACVRAWTSPRPVTAAAHKLARLIYTMLTKGEEYTDQGQDYYEERYRQRVLRQLSQRAEKLGMKLVVSEQAA